MLVHPDQADPNWKHSFMTYRDCGEPPLDTNGIDDRINNQMMKTADDILVHLTALENIRNPEIGTPKREKGDIFSEFYTESLKGKSCDV